MIINLCACAENTANLSKGVAGRCFSTMSTNTESPSTLKSVAFKMEESGEGKVSCDSPTSLELLYLKRKQLRRASTFTTQCV